MLEKIQDEIAASRWITDSRCYLNELFKCTQDADRCWPDWEHLLRMGKCLPEFTWNFLILKYFKILTQDVIQMLAPDADQMLFKSSFEPNVIMTPDVIQMSSRWIYWLQM